MKGEQACTREKHSLPYWQVSWQVFSSHALRRQNSPGDHCRASGFLYKTIRVWMDPHRPICRGFYYNREKSPNPMIRLCAIDDLLPGSETISSREYPLSAIHLKMNQSYSVTSNSLCSKIKYEENKEIFPYDPYLCFYRCHGNPFH